MGAVVLGDKIQTTFQHNMSFFKQFKKISKTQRQILRMVFHLPAIYWKDNTARAKQLSCWGGVRDNSLIQEMDRANAQVGVMFTNRDRLIWNTIISGSFGCSDHEMEKLKIPRGEKVASSTL